MSDYNYETFVRVYENAFSKEFCHGLINYFEWCLENNRTWDRPEGNNLKKDKSTSLNPITYWDIQFAGENLATFISEFNDVFWNRHYLSYRNEFDTLNNYERHTVFTYKLQKTIPGGGYHLWHCENGARAFNNRFAAYIVYLNDVAQGGETEFLHQNIRVPPKQGSLVIFPANYTHPHRGNPPLQGTKYILTGWLELC